MTLSSDQIDDLTELFSLAYSCADGDKLRAAVADVANAAVRMDTAPLGAVHLVTRVVCRKFGITRRQFRKGSRSPAFAHPRFVAALVLRDVYGLSLLNIAAAIGRDHATVLHGIRKVREDARLMSMASAAKDLVARLETRMPSRRAA